VDEMEISSRRPSSAARALFDGIGDDLHGSKLVRTVTAPDVAHIKFAKR